jgi:hypothetical protein
MPYHFTGGSASDLITEIEGILPSPDDVAFVIRVSRTGPEEAYTLTGGGAGIDFPLVPGEAYKILMNEDVSGWIPSHY